jgi:flagellar biosynthesis anti-sigma factor FlgM
MTIQDSNLHGIGTSSTGAARTGAPDAAGSRSKSAIAFGGQPTDAVELSSLVRQIGGLQTDSAAREARVDALREAYLSGSYRVDAASTASKLVSDALRG